MEVPRREELEGLVVSLREQASPPLRLAPRAGSRSHRARRHLPALVSVVRFQAVVPQGDDAQYTKGDSVKRGEMPPIHLDPSLERELAEDEAREAEIKRLRGVVEAAAKMFWVIGYKDASTNLLAALEPETPPNGGSTA
jgi:hypothetical protein